ncbi:hypothetical protein L6R29_17145 [Myxococcota bacterium]|nr:hypothetical protein [Myxococcota bacterium]
MIIPFSAHYRKTLSSLFYRKTLSSLLFVFFAAFALCACSSNGQVAFVVEGIAPSAGGSFTNRLSFRIDPKTLRLVLGDLQLGRTDPAQDLQSFDSLPPLLTPGQAVDPSEIGKEGRFPGMTVVNLLPGATTTENILPQGRAPADTWKEARLRFAPAVVGVRGVNSQDPLFQRTLLFEAVVQKDTTLRCDLLIQIPFQMGVALRIQPFTVQPNGQHTNKIRFDYAKWFEDINFESVCAGAKATVIVNETQNTAIFDQIRTAIPSSISFQFSAGQ